MSSRQEKATQDTPEQSIAETSRDPFSFIYELALGDEDSRACKDISEAACAEQPKSFGMHVVSMTLTKIGDGLSDVKLTLAWLLSSLGVPAYLVSWLVPVRESLSLLPQLAIAGKLRTYAKRKLFWTFGSLAQGACVAAMGVAGLLFEGPAAGYVILTLLAAFSLARGVCSIASKDVLGKTVAKTRRGRVSGIATSAAGSATLLFGALLFFDVIPRDDAELMSGLLVFAGGLWVSAALIYAGIPEQPGATSGGRNGLKEALASMRLVVTDHELRHFLITRSLFISTALVAPFYVILANRNTSGGAGTLGLLLLLAGLANLLSSPLWGRFADTSSKRVLVAAGTLCATLAGVVVIADVWSWPVVRHPGWYAGVIFVLYIGHAGVRLGRKTYLIDMATQDNRARLVAVSNTVIGIVLLIAGGVSTLAAQSGTLGAIAIFGAFSLLAALAAAFMRDVSG